MAGNGKRSSGSQIPPSGSGAVKARIVKATAKPKAHVKHRDPKPMGDPSRPPPGYQPPRHETLATEIRPPSTPRERLLPLVDVGSRRFEELCQALVRPEFTEVARTALKRTTGVAQFGVDVEGFDRDGYPTVVVSAKCYREIKAWDFRPWIDDFMKKLSGHWKDKRVKHFVLAVTHECNDDDMNDAARRLVAELRTKGIEFHLWDSNRMTEMLSQDETLVARFFNEYWVRAIVARVSQVQQAVAGGARLQNDSTSSAMFAQYEAMAKAIELPVWQRVDGAMATGLDAALERLREGRSAALLAWLAGAQADRIAWDSIDPAMRAKALRVSAMLRARDGDPDAAILVLDEADALAEPPDAVARAFVARMQGDLDRAIDMLRNRTTQRERELEAGLLIEAGRAPEALEVLGVFNGAAVTSEVLRLRSIARFLGGDRERALREATSASEKAPQDMAPLLTLATVRLFMGLVDGVRPQFGGMPQPLAAGLFKGTARARSLLSQAIADFDRLRHSVDGPLRAECDMWRFAALALHPERREEATQVARALLAGDQIEPVAVCWALAYGLVRRAGRVKKTLGDAVRTDRGTSTHLLAFALMSVDAGRPDRAVAAMVLHAHRYPEAAEFLATWRARFGDPTVAPVEGLAAVIRRCLASGRNGELLVFLMPPAIVDESGSPVDGVGNSAVEDVLTGAEFLASRSAWDDLVALRPRLLAMATPRTVYLAAVAAVESGDPEACLRILDDAAVAGEGRLSRHLVHLRIRANEALGFHAPVIADLVAMRRDGADAYVDGRLMETYARIGALPEFEALAAAALDQGRLDARRALHVAHLLRSAAPATALRALEIAAASMTPDLAGSVLSLATELGASKIQDDLLRGLGGRTPGPGLRALSGVDELLAFLEERTREYGERFASWLSGHAPAAVVMNADARTFVRLFLADPDERRNQVGEPYPMLLRTGGVRAPAAPPTGERPPLRLDVGALLLADRLAILPEVETLFAIVVPPSLPEALREFEADFRPSDVAWLDAVERALDTGRSALRFTDAVPAQTLVVERDDQRGELDGGVVALLLDRAFADGHLGEAALGDARVALGATEAPAEAFETAVLSPFAVYRLAAAGVLQEIARGTPVFLRSADADACRRDLRRWVHDRGLSERLSRLRAIVAERLAVDRWTTIAQSALIGLEENERATAHVRCLLEIIAAQTHAPVSFWIEDRALSHGRLEGALDVLDVLDGLHARGLMTGARRTACRRRLREFGYAFMPVEPTEIMAEISAAPFDGSALVETDELADLRRWFAREVGRLAHVDRYVRHAEDGSVLSEARRLIDVGGLARTLLLAIWMSGTSTLDRKRAESGWIWAFLSTDHIPGGERGDATATLGALAAIVVHTLDIPLVAGLGEGPAMPVEVGQAFVDWFMAVEVESVSKADREATGVLADHLAWLADRFLERPRDLEPDQDRWLRNVFAARVRAFLEFLPRKWRERVLDRRDLRERLGMRTVVSFVMKEGVSCVASALSEAYAAALAAPVSGDGVQVDMSGAGSASLTLDASGARARPVLTIEGVKGTLDPATSALIDPDSVTRAQAILEVEGLVEPSGTIRRADLERIAAIVDLDPRLSAFDDMLAADVDRRLRIACDRLWSEGRLSPDDIDPPPVQDMLRYLRSSDSPGDGTDRLDGLDRRLLEDVDLGEAALRLAGLPIDPSSIFLRDLGVWLNECDGSVFKVESPLFALLRARAVIAVAEEDGGSLVPALEAVVEAMRQRGRLFVALVRYAGGKTLERDDWLALDPGMHVALLWAFADRLTQIMAPPGADLDELAEVLLTRGAYGPAQRELVAQRPQWTRRLTVELSVDRLAGALVDVLLRAGRPFLVERPAPFDLLRALVGQDAESSYHPKVDLIAVPPEGPAGFWAAGDVVAGMVACEWIEEDRWYAVRDDATLVERLTEAEWVKANPAMLPVLLFYVDLGRIQAAALPGLRELVEGIDAEAVFEPDKGGAQRAMRMRASLLSKLDVVDAMHAALVRQAGRCAELWHQPLQSMPDEAPATVAFGLIVEAAFMHAMALPRPRAERLEVFAHALRAVSRRWTGSAPVAVATLDAMTRHEGVKAAALMWPVLLEMRADF